MHLVFCWGLLFFFCWLCRDIENSQRINSDGKKKFCIKENPYVSCMLYQKIKVQFCTAKLPNQSKSKEIPSYICKRGVEQKKNTLKMESPSQSWEKEIRKARQTHEWFAFVKWWKTIWVDSIDLPETRFELILMKNGMQHTATSNKIDILSFQNQIQFYFINTLKWAKVLISLDKKKKKKKKQIAGDVSCMLDTNMIYS